MDDSYKVLKIATGLGMTTSEYVYLIPRISENLNNPDEPWISDDGTKHTDAKEGFRSVLIVSEEDQ